MTQTPVESNRTQTVARILTLCAYLLLYGSFAYLIVHKPMELGGSDYWMHAGHVAVFSEDLESPRQIYDEAERLRVRNFSPYQFVLASMVRYLGLTPVDATVAGALFSVGLLFISVWLLATRFGANPWLPLGLLTGILFFVGAGFKWSSEIDATVLPRFASYPSYVATGLSLLCWYAADLLIERFSWLRFAAVSLMTALIFLLHQFIFLFFLVILFFWVLPSARAWKAAPLLASSVATGMALTLLWPYFNPFDVALGAALGTAGETRPDNLILRKAEENKFNQLPLVIQGLGPALLAFPLLFLLDERLRWRLGGLLLFSLAVWWLPQLGLRLIPTSGYRWTMLSLLSMQLICGAAIATLLHSAFAPDKTTTRRGLSAVALTALGGILIWQSVALFDLYGKYVWPRYNKTLSATRKMELFTDQVKAQGIGGPIVADVWQSYALPAFQLESVNFGRKLSPVTDRLMELYAADTSPQRRRELIEGFETPFFILRISEETRPSVADFDEIGELITSKTDSRLYRLVGAREAGD